jgi:acetyl/propionyl-CoA carboxylase alpha subunit
MTAFPFDTVLVANRGEIAARILRSVKALGLRGLVLHHKADLAAPALALADGVVDIEGATPVAAFLDGDQIIAKAHSAGAQAVHPGYGFLSENTAFCSAVGEAGLLFVGPSPESMSLMGDKIRARAFVAAQRFPVAPSVIEDDDPAHFAERARALNVPLLIKPAAGGGGKGMHIVRSLADLDDALAQARREGMRYFGDGRLYVERYIETPRHIEVQILADHHGTVLHLHERECSLQRRFQKIIEEAPATSLSLAQRQQICDAAVGIAQAAGYRNAGTVEFIYGNGEFFFLEMNTRLQVEHPVTEAITGLDLVAEQLRIAAGEKLRLTQRDIRLDGHAIELRICAEDAAHEFAPCTGPVLAWAFPESDGVRMDSGIARGARITAAFDPLLAKLIVHAPTRAQALRRAHSALQDTILLGCTSNIGFLGRLLAHPAVAAGALHTGLVQAELPNLQPPALTPEQRQIILATSALASPALRNAADAVPPLHAAMGGWRN